MAKLPCPIPGYDETGEDGQPRYYVTVPDEWLGIHAEAYYQTQQALEGSTLTPLYRDFCHSLALADDYRLPLLEGKPDNWPADVFPRFPIKVMTWVNWLLVRDYIDCFAVKKNWLRPSLIGLKPTGTNQAPGTLAASLFPLAEQRRN